MLRCVASLMEKYQPSSTANIPEHLNPNKDAAEFRR
jgi:hypothetical protein